MAIEEPSSAEARAELLWDEPLTVSSRRAARAVVWCRETNTTHEAVVGLTQHRGQGEVMATWVSHTVVQDVQPVRVRVRVEVQWGGWR